MECNKDEALRAKEIAEKKFEAKDIAGAKKFAMKAQNLFPGLEGIGQMIATLDVHLASELKVNGEKDLYAIFSVHPMVDDDTLKKQYRKLALLLHPDKNKSVGSEGAFQLISEAWNVLSDKSKRSLFDQKRNTKGLQQRSSQSNNDHSAPKAANTTKKSMPKARAPKSTATAARSAASPLSTAPPTPTAPPTSTAPPPSNASKPSTFWTYCHLCKMKYEFLRLYLNHHLLCPRCHEPFLATESPIPAGRTNSSVPCSASRQHPNSNHNSTVRDACGPEKCVPGVPGIGSFANPNFQWGPFSRTAGAASAAASSTAAAQAANVVQQTYERVKRDREEAQAAARKLEAIRKRYNASKRKHFSSENPNVGLASSVPHGEHPSFPNVDKPPKKRRNIGDDSGTGSEADQMTTGTVNSGMKDLPRFKLFNSTVNSSGMGRSNGLSGNSFSSRVSARQNNLSSELLQLDTRKTLIAKTKVSIHRKLEEWKSTKEANIAEKEKAKKKQKHEETIKENVKVASSGDDPAQVLVDSRSSGSKVHVKKDSNGHSAESDNEVIEPVAIDVPDPDFHDFDKDRSERSFKSEQIWATYDEEDGMPRYYALVQKVISLKPFKIRMSFLTSKSNSEFGPIDWVASGFAKTAGDFRVGRYETNDTINIFSHKVRWEKGPRGVIKIVPKKGEIWALYRNWSSDWNEHTPDDVIYKYDMVEVLEDYNEEQGVSIAPLVKVAGFKTVFRRHLDLNEVKKIPREEMFRFSHQVPSTVLTGEEAHNAPKGCCELDPAATPLELLQVTPESEDGEVMKTAKQQSAS